MSNLPPPISPNDRPPLHKITEFVFQDLTVELMANEPDLRLARLYGTRGQRQYGADAIADCTGGGIAVAQCKCYAALTASDVREACKEFEKSFHYWKKQDARRFILAVACDATSTKIIDEVAKQRKHLKRRNIAFEVWDRIIIVQRLQGRPNLVSRYLVGSSTWVSILCGPQEKHAASLSANSSDAERQLLQSMLAEHVEKEVQSLREALRKGRRGEVRTRLKSLRGNSAKWALLSDRIQAAALRLEAALELDSTLDIQRAKALIADAHRLDPDSSVVRLETRIRLLEFGPAEALEALPDLDDLETLCARGSILIHLGNTDEAIRILLAAKERFPKDADTLRLLAVAHLAQGEVHSALSVLSELVAVAPDWEIALHTKAVIFYVSTLSSPRLQHPGGAFPEPVEWSFVRRDDESVRRLAEAEAIFETLLADPDRPRGDRYALELWRLACMANDANRQTVDQVMHVLATVAHYAFSLAAEASDLRRASCLRIMPPAYETNRRQQSAESPAATMELCARQCGSRRTGRAEARGERSRWRGSSWTLRQQATTRSGRIPDSGTRLKFERRLFSGFRRTPNVSLPSTGSVSGMY